MNRSQGAMERLSEEKSWFNECRAFERNTLTRWSKMGCQWINWYMQILSKKQYLGEKKRDGIEIILTRAITLDRKRHFRWMDVVKYTNRVQYFDHVAKYLLYVYIYGCRNVLIFLITQQTSYTHTWLFERKYKSRWLTNVSMYVIFIH